MPSTALPRTCGAGLLVMTLLAPHLGCQTSLGAAVGTVLDAPEARAVAGVDLRVAIRDTRWVVNPRVAIYFAHQGASATQVDGNLLYRFRVGESERLEPFAGVGGTVVRGDLATPGVLTTGSRFGLNLVTGATLRGSSSIVPFVQAVYTVILEDPNSFSLLAGIRWTLVRTRRPP